MKYLNQKISQFLRYLRNEIENCDEIYGKEISGSLKAYYTMYRKKGKAFDFAQFYYKKRVTPLVKNIYSGLAILDAGCGVGTESILFSSFGGKVTGVDIKESRIETAKKRKEYFEKKLNTHLEIQFKFENIMNHSGKYDLIWINEAISHINPLNKFINRCYKNLNPNGKLVIVDANKTNPIVYRNSKLDQKRSGGIIKTFSVRDPKTNKEISYAVERVFHIPSIKSILSKLFDVKEVDTFGYIPYFLFRFFPEFFKILENQISKLPIIKNLSGIYSLVCVKK